jgi:hypothetical protein
MNIDRLWTRFILRPLTIVFKWAHNCDESPLNGTRGGSGDQRSGSENFDSDVRFAIARTLDGRSRVLYLV